MRSLRNARSVARKPKLELLAETTLAYAVLDRFPVSKGHTLVTPKKHVANFFDLSLSEQNQCWQVVNETYRN